MSASSLLPPFVSGLVSLLVGHCVRLVPLLFPFVSLLVSHFVGHCVRLPSCLPSLCPHVSLLSPFASGLESLFCFLLSPFLLVIWSVLSPFCFLLSPFLSPLLSPFLLVIVSALSSFFPLHLSPLSPSRLQSFTFVSQLLCPAILYICLPVSTFVSQLWAAVSASALQSFTFVSPRWAAVSASALQSFTCVLASLCICLPALDCYIRLCLATQLWAACRLQSFTVISLCLHLSPSFGLLWPPLPCNPLSSSSGRRKL